MSKVFCTTIIWRRFRRFYKITKSDYQLRLVRLSARQSAWNSSAPTRRIPPKNWYYIFFEKFVNKVQVSLTLSNPIFLPTAYSPALICFGREKGWWITCNYPTVLKEKITEKQKEYSLRYLSTNVRKKKKKTSDRLRQRANKRNENRVGRFPTSERSRKIILSDEVRRRLEKG
jgi:hypothetical protein